MAGNGNSGRPRKPTAKLKLHGTYRDDRHAERFDDSGLDDELVKPELDSVAGELWDAVVPQLVANGIAKAVDAAELRGMCEWYSRYRTCMKSLADAPTEYWQLENGDIEVVPKVQTMAANAWKAFSTTAAKFGLSPSDRAKLAVDPKPQQSDFDKDIAKHG